MSDPGRELQALLGSRLPEGHEREQRVRWIAETALALIRNELPSHEACVFVGGALMAWLEQGGDLCREYFRVVKRASHHTPSYLYRQLEPHQDERQHGDADGILLKLSADGGQDADAGTD
jgi:hypothetical protein